MARAETTFASQPAENRATRNEPNADPGAFGRMVHAMGKQLDQGESLMHGVLSGAPTTRSYSSVDLLVLQAGIYRYVEAVELAARLVDRAGQVIRTTLQSSSG
jgi:hypothetical protein